MASIGILEIILAVISFLFVRYHFHKAKGLPRNYPLLGMLPDVYVHLNEIHDRTAQLLERTGCNFLFKGPRFAGMDAFITADPINVHHIMSTNFANFPKGAKFEEIFDVLGDGIFNADSELWKDQRKVAQGLIKHRSFHRFLVKSCMAKVEKGLIPVLEHVAKQGLVVDLQDLFQRFTFDITCMLVTGYDPSCLSIHFPEVQFSKAMDTAMESIFYRHSRPRFSWKLQRRLRIGQEAKMKIAWKTLDRVVAEYISKKREQLHNHQNSISKEDNNEEGVDMLTSYMTEVEIMGSKPDDKLLRDTIVNLLLAGRDTVSSGLTWFLWLVATNPEVEGKIRDELKAIIPAKEAEAWRLFSPEEVKDLLYLHGTMCESLRLYPPVPLEHKAPLQAVVFPSGHHLDPKMKILISLYAMGRMTSIWGKDCSEFKPERWITERGGIKYETPSKFLAFNAGPRTCLGKEVAFIEMKAVAASIIHNYQIQVVEGQTVVPSHSVILHMKHGLNVRVTGRWG